MGFIWFWFVAAMLAAYVVLDGFDLGVGILHPWLGRSENDKQLLFRTIGPVWDGNEVWLIAGGGTLYFAFPALYASSFSGFYLPLMMVLWLLILRGIAIEFRSHIRSEAWQPLWDVVFAGASAQSATGAKSTLIPSRARSRPSSRPKRSHASASPAAPTAIADGNCATASPMRATRPPS